MNFELPEILKCIL